MDQDPTQAQETLLAEVLDRFATTPDPRLRQLLLALIRHLHEFVRESRPTWQEWEAAMAFCARAAAVTGPGRNEFIALSDAVGLTMQVLASSQPKPPGATIPTLIGPFHLANAPWFPNGADIAGAAQGERLHVSGRVLDIAGEPVAGAILSVWHSDERGLYDVQDDPAAKGLWARGRLRSTQDGGFAFWTVMPAAYPAPMDAALGDLIGSTTRMHWRPAHLHVAIEAPENQTAETELEGLTTHVFVRGSPYLDQDFAFGVRPGLVADFTLQPPGIAPDGRVMAEPYRTLTFDFVLTRKRQAGSPFP